MQHIRTTLVASTADTYCCSIAESRFREAQGNDGETAEAAPRIPEITVEQELEVNYFKNTQWSADGTSLLTSSADNAIRTFILPPNLLDASRKPITLVPYTAHTYPSSINCVSPYPVFTLSDTSTTLYLSTPNALPIRLTNALSSSPVPISTYPLMSLTTEQYYTPSSLLWSSSAHFLAGTDCLVALFDVSRNGDGPISRMPTIPSKRHKMKGGGVGMRGVVSALSMQPSLENADAGMLAAGTWTRWVGLYDMAGMGGTVATWSIAEASDVHAGVGGSGITQTLWSACGRYLFVVERKSRGVLIFDVRVTGKLVAWLEGREADTNQRLGVDVFGAETGSEIWAGGTDGIVKVWEGAGMTEDAVQKSWEWKAHDGPVTSVAVHASGSVAATCSGERSYPASRRLSFDTEDRKSIESGSDHSSDDEHKLPISQSISQTPDNNVKVWSL